MKTYFPGLNALRFFAAYLVLMHHAETIRHKYGLFNWQAFSLFQNGSLAVSFFFVLSGFLITFLLLSERSQTGTVSIRLFLTRRILRIWPLYFLLVALGLFIVPFFLRLIHYAQPLPYNIWSTLGLFVLFLSFVVNALYGTHLLEPLWSIGVEEYFYVLWAPLFKYVKKNPLRLIISVILIKDVIWIGLMIWGADRVPIIYDVVAALKFELMAIGGIGAYAVFKNRPAVERAFIFNPLFQMALLTLIFVRLCIHLWMLNQNPIIYAALFNTPVLSEHVEGFLFLWLILNTSINPRSIYKLDRPWLNKLGEISYGVYMYQMLILFGVILTGKKILSQLPPVAASLCFYGLASFLIILVAWLSKKYFEDYFLKLKRSPT